MKISFALSILLLITAASRCLADAPRICYVSSGGGASIVIGEGFDSTAKVLVWNAAVARTDLLKYAGDLKGPATPPVAPPADAREVSPVTVTNDQVLDVALPDDSNVIWVKTAGGVSPPRLVNVPEIWLTTDDRPAPGEHMRLFGRNFGQGDNARGRSIVFRNRQTGDMTSARPATLSEQYWEHTVDHVIGLVVPEGLADGPYDILVHSGGGAYGWSAPYRVDIAGHRSLAEALSRPDQPSAGLAAGAAQVKGAVGDGVHDDTQAIQSALDEAAAASGGVVSLPAGEYAISRTLHVKPGVFLRGAGAQATSLIVSPIMPLQEGPEQGPAPYPRDMPPMIWLETQSGVSDMSLLGGPGAKSAVYVATRDGRVSQDVSVVRTDITTPERMFQLGGYHGFQDAFGVSVDSPTRNFTLFQCHIRSGEPLWMSPGRIEHYGATITNNTFDDFPRQGSDNVFLKGINHSVIEDNDFIGGARALTSQEGLSNCWIFNNRVTDDGGWANAEEMFMSEYGGSSWAGACQSASADTIQAQRAHWTAGQFTDRSDPIFVFIKLGKGFGQLRTVTMNTADTLTVDTPWDIVPDTTTRFAVLPLTYRNLYINDQTIDCNGRCEFAYGSLVECVISGLNTRDSEGISSTAVNGGVIAFNDYSYNRLIGMSGIRLGQSGYWDDGVVRIPGVDIGDVRRGNVIANTIRYNEVMDFKDYALNQYGAYWENIGPAADSPGISVSGGSFNVIEDNYVTKGAVGVRVGDGEGDVILRNRIDDVLTPIVDRGRGTFVRSRE